MTPLKTLTTCPVMRVTLLRWLGLLLLPKPFLQGFIISFLQDTHIPLHSLESCCQGQTLQRSWISTFRKHLRPRPVWILQMMVLAGLLAKHLGGHVGF